MTAVAVMACVSGSVFHYEPEKVGFIGGCALPLFPSRGG